MSPAATASAWNVANGLTVLRIVLVPVFVLLLFAAPADEPASPWRFGAWAVFAVASITDLVDGDVARRWGMVTDFGKIADPIADKALTGAAFVTLSVLGELSWWVTAVILFREIGVTLLRFWVIRHGVIPASRGGKYKTFLQTIAIGLYLLPLQDTLATVAAWVMGAAVVLTVVTGADYVVRALALRRAATPRP